MKKSKLNGVGFTLVELIVVIAIMGVILILALPQVSKIQSANKTKKYAAYKGSFTAAAKIYIDNHKKDLFGNRETGCVTITYDDLKKDNLIKDFSESGVDCNYNNESKVDVTKDHDQYYYSTDITCTKDGKKVYYEHDSSKEGAVVCFSGEGGIGGGNECDPSTDPDCDPDCLPGEEDCPLPEGCKPGDAVCPDPDKTPPDIYATPSSSDGKWYTTANIVKQLKLQFVVYDSSGLNKNISIQWTWKNKDTGESSSYSYDFKNKADKGTTILPLSVPENKIPTATGHYSVVISPKSTATSYGVQDFLGNVRYSSSDVFQDYQIDNVNPTMSPSIVSTEKDYNSLKTSITISGSDDVGVDQMYISNKGYEKGGEWVAYKNVFEWDLDGDYDGEERTIYITIKDYAGNKINKELKYTVYKACTKQEDYGDWKAISSCSAQCGDGSIKKEIKRRDKYINSISCGVREDTFTCNLGPCCSASNPSGCATMYVCKGRTYFHQDAAYSTGSQTLLPWAKVYVLEVGSEFTKVYVDSSQPHVGSWNRYSVGYIKSECLVTWSSYSAYRAAYPKYEEADTSCYQYMAHERSCFG